MDAVRADRGDPARGLESRPSDALSFLVEDAGIECFVEVLITPDGCGAQLVVLVQGPEELRAPDERKWIRYRLGTLFGEALRDWVDEGVSAD